MTLALGAMQPEAAAKKSCSDCGTVIAQPAWLASSRSRHVRL